MSDKKNISRRTLAHKTLESIMALGITLTAVICFVVMFTLTNHSIATHTQDMFSCAEALAAVVDGDKIVEYVKTGKKDKEYDRITKYMKTVYRNTAMIINYFVYVPDEKGYTFVWLIDEDYTEDTDNTYLGEWEKYGAGEKEATKALFNGESAEKIMANYKMEEFLLPAAAVIYNKAGKPVAIAGANFDVRYVKQGVNSVLQLIAFISLIVITGSVYLYYRLNLESMVRPLEELNKGVEEMVADLKAGKRLKFHVKTGDEIEDLADGFEKMYEETCSYMKKITDMAAERERVDTELSLAAKIQTEMLPTTFPAFPEIENLDIFASMEPAKEVGGDFYDFFLVDKDHIALVIADVSGKGIPASLFMMMTKILISNSAELGLTPKEIIERANEKICSNNEEGMFVTVWLGILNLKNGHVDAVNAGHEYPLIRKPQGEFAVFKDPHDFVVGGMADMDFEGYEFTLEKGSTLFVYTDGLVESMNWKEELFGEMRMLDAINQDPGVDARQLVKNVKISVNDFVGKAAQFDDMTMMAVRFL